MIETTKFMNLILDYEISFIFTFFSNDWYKYSFNNHLIVYQTEKFRVP
jgi:hypothetical protein